MKNIVFIHGAYHGAWCWEEKFLKYFEDEGYKTYCPDIKKPSQKKSTGKRISVLQQYVENMSDFIDGLNDKPVIVVHSAFSIVVLEFMRKYQDKVKGVVFLSPLPIGLELPRIWISGISQVMLGMKKVFFSDRLTDEEAKPYMDKLCRENGSFLFETCKNHWDKSKKFKVKTLWIGSENDNCVRASWIRKTAEAMDCECIIYKSMCHDLMLDPAAPVVSRDILNFAEAI